ncbi:MAG: DUF2868 domain-containing protein [Gammaproteobacteria bacterium]|nr:DUF2868 domain-containing protein [Gammaproteobacteria bacterium]
MHATVWSYLLTQAWRHFEAARGELVRDAALEARLADARLLPAQAKIARRAQALAGPAGVTLALQTTCRRWRACELTAVALAAILGLLASRVIPEGFPARANLLVLLGALLLPNLASLAAWLLLQGLSVLGWLPAAPGGMGRQFARLGLFATAGNAAAGAAARQALLEFQALTPTGRWSLAVLTHACWAAAVAGMMLGCWLLLLARQVDFYWGSTLLDPPAVQALLHTLGQPLAALGWPVPGVGDIAASRIDVLAQDAVQRQRWGYLALGALLVYGLLPRLVCLAGSLLLRAWSARQLQVDLQAPDYWRVSGLLAARAPTLVVLDADRASPGPAVALPRGAQAPLPAGAAWLALERPLVAARDCDHDFGCIATRADQARVLAALTAPAAWPALVVQAALVSIPDRGVHQFLARVVKLAAGPVYLRVLDTPETGDWSPAQCSARADDWATLAAGAGLAGVHFARLQPRSAPVTP